MASYWIVVPRGNAELFDLLSIAFRGRPGFAVIVDRRAMDCSAGRGDGAERRSVRAELGPDEIVVAEQAARTDHTSAMSQRPHRRIPVVRSASRGRVRRRTGEPARGSYAARPSSPATLTR
jgi:hypothetical protein